jgi:hypothetical protein
MIAPLPCAGKLLFLSENSSPATHNPKKQWRWHVKKRVGTKTVSEKFWQDKTDRGHPGSHRDATRILSTVFAKGYTS